MAQGRRVQKRLTSKEIASLNQAGRYADGGNLYLQVGPSGSKSWAFLYKMPGGRPRQMGFGPLEFVSLPDARQLAAEARLLIFKGTDPLDVKKATTPKRTRTFKDVAEEAINSFKDGWKNAKSEDQWRASLTTYVYPLIGDTPVNEVTTADVFDLLRPIWATKTETANRVRGRIEQIMDFAGHLKLRSGENPARWVGNLKHLLPRRSKVTDVEHHAALPYAEINGFVTALKSREGTAARALELVILTAARTSEALNATWSEFDLGGKVWTIPKERMKGNREHRVPLSRAALDLLHALPREDGDEYLFLSGTAGRPLSNMAMLAVLKRMDRTDLTVHGFRSTFRDWAADTTSYPGDVVEMALAHAVSNQVEAAYRRGDLFEKRRKLMEDWGKYTAIPPSPGANVVPIKGGSNG